MLNDLNSLQLILWFFFFHTPILLIYNTDSLNIILNDWNTFHLICSYFSVIIWFLWFPNIWKWLHVHTSFAQFGLILPFICIPVRSVPIRHHCSCWKSKDFSSSKIFMKIEVYICKLHILDVTITTYLFPDIGKWNIRIEEYIGSHKKKNKEKT